MKRTIRIHLLSCLLVAAPIGARAHDGEASAGPPRAAPDENADAPAPSVARLWDEQLLAAIRLDIPKPPVHARNLFHLAAAMWDAWAAYDGAARGYLTTEKHVADDVAAARDEAISFAAYRLLQYRFPAIFADAAGRPCHPSAVISQAAFDAQFSALGYDATLTSTEGDSPAALGNRIATAYIDYGSSDGANEGLGNCYPDDTNYTPQNPPLIFQLPVLIPGVSEIVEPNRWQPLVFDFAVTQNGIVLGKSIQKFIGVGWGDVRPFALTSRDITPASLLYSDPGPPPQLGGAGEETLRDAIVEVVDFSSRIDPREETTIDISPGAAGKNNRLGTDTGRGHRRNPFTRRPYAHNVVKRADYIRVAAQFWADGPHSETPPGHWNVIANEVADRLRPREKRIGGRGRAVDALEWDVKMYFALNGALHDAAIWAWGVKHYYDSSRPITLIRYMASRGQSSDVNGPSYDPRGLPLIDDEVELVSADTTAPGGRHEHLLGNEGRIAVRSWLGSPSDIQGSVGGVGWILGTAWMPYQLATFVTPPFPGYVSGHSTYSRSAAEVLTAMTASEFFPGGIASFVAEQDRYLAFERGPSQTIELQWATYFDAADDAGKSRRFGGIHPYYDDYPGRIAGSKLGQHAWLFASQFFGETCPAHLLED